MWKYTEEEIDSQAATDAVSAWIQEVRGRSWIARPG